MQTPTTTYRPDIDGLRAIAILPVIFFHAFPLSITGGFIGVDVFFVISGYLITSIIVEEIARGNFSYGSFYSRRVRRLFPTLLAVLVSTIVIGWNMLSAQEYKQLARHVLAGLSFLANINLWSEAGYFDAAADSKPLLHLWSLGVEEQFYIVWPALAILLLPLFKRAYWVIFSSLAILIAAAAMTSSWSTEAAFYLPFSRFWELFCGAAISFATNRHSVGRTDKAFEIGACIGLLLILVPAYFLTSSSAFPLPWAVAPVAGASILIVTHGSFINRVVLSNRILVGIGLISYSLYLWHWPLLSFLHIEYSGLAANWMRALALVLAFILATSSYWLLEKPFRSKSRSALKLWILGIIAVLTGIIAANIYARDGLGFRVDSIISQVIGEKDPHKQAWRGGECFIERDGIDQFAPNCIGSKANPDVFLWGDSHAAALYPGLAKIAAETGASLAQYTASLCKPLLDDNMLTAACKAGNTQSLMLIVKTRPSIVVMHARWDYASDAPLITDTVKKLKAAGAERIVFVGPSPRWNDDLPRLVFNYYRKHHQMPAQYSSECKYVEAEREDQAFAALAKQLQIGYVTFAGTLFLENGCPLRTASDSKDIMMFDADHLTVAGSFFVGPSVWRQIVENRLTAIGLKQESGRR